MREYTAEQIDHFDRDSRAWGSGFMFPDSASLKQVEAELGLQLPESYITFIEAIKGSSIHISDMTLGNKDHSPAGSPDWPGHAVCFFQDGFGNAYFFDTRSPSEDGEYPILFWDHEDPTEHNAYNLIKTDDSFSAWLDRYISDVITPRVQRLVKPASIFGCVMLCILALAILIGIVWWVVT